MNKSTAPLLVGILLLSILFGANYYDSQQVRKERAELRKELDETAAKLQQAQQEQTRLREELNQTQTQVTQLEGKITELEENITALQNELKNIREDLQMRTGAITIGLTFLWNPQLSNTGITTQFLQVTIDAINEIWDSVDIYYFIYHAQPDHNTPLTMSCDAIMQFGKIIKGLPVWADEARQLYAHTPDIPIALTHALRLFYGCGLIGEPGIAISVFESDMPLAILLSHELAHNLGFSEYSFPYYTSGFPSSMYGEIQLAAKPYQMPIPLDES